MEDKDRHNINLFEHLKGKGDRIVLRSNLRMRVGVKSSRGQRSILSPKLNPTPHIRPGQRK